jgi:hypothetical protein
MILCVNPVYVSVTKVTVGVIGRRVKHIDYIDVSRRNLFQYLGEDRQMQAVLN